MPKIPDIADYPMPTESDLPKNTVDWRPDPERCALLVHDLQHFFLRAFTLDGSPLTDLIAHTRTLRDLGDRVGIPVIYTVQPGGMSPADRGLLKDIWGPGMAASDEHRATPERLTPRPGDLVLTKHRYSAFHRTALLERLRAHGRDQLLLTGVFAHIGILATALDAFAHDIQPFLVADAVADFSDRWHRTALEHAAACCAMVVSTERAVRELGGPGA